MQCDGIVRKEQCKRQISGRSGYFGAPQSKAIVLHLIQGIDAASFENIQRSPLPTFWENNNLPKSVHFVVTDTAKIQYANLSDTTFGFDYLLDVTWPEFYTLLPIEDINGPFIHVGFFGDQLNPNLIELLCCIISTIGYQLPIIAASDIQADRPKIQISSDLSEQINQCALSGGIQTPPNVFDLEDRIRQLEQCCLVNTTEINKLKRRVLKNEQDIVILKSQVAALQQTIVYLEQQIAIIPALQAQIELLIQQVQDILTRCCPQPVDASCFHYQLLPGDEMVITPNQPVWLNLPTKIEDTIPPLVLTGPLWRAKLLGNCNWNLEGIVRFRLKQWCAGKKAKLSLVYCGQTYLVAEKIITSTNTQQVTLEFSTIIPPGCEDVHLLVSIDDDVAKIVEFAQFKGCSC